jgi:hypothetical protein
MSASTPDTDHQALEHAVYHSIHHTHKALQEIRALLEASVQELSVGGSIVDRDLENWPVPGLTRKVLSNRRVTGTDSFTATAATPALIVDSLPGRLGGTIVNAGANPAILYLVGPGHITAIAAGNPAIFIAANGGSWDFRLGNVPWSGPVSVISALGTTLTVVQF